MKNIKNFGDFNQLIVESAKTQEAFRKKVEKLLVKYGSVEKSRTANMVIFELETNFGKFITTIFTDTDSLYTIFNRFDDTDAIKDVKELKQFTINYYSGKCNFHDKNATGVLTDFEELLIIITK